MSNRDLWLAQARAACFLTGVGDLAENLCRANMAYGLAKIRFVQREMGISPDACFVGAPDATITRNVDRWESGFGYGGRIRYSGDFAVLSVRSNCCGIFFGLLDQAEDAGAVLRRIRALQADPPRLAGGPVSWDFGASNHFISLVRFPRRFRAHRYGLLVHGSGPELRGEGAHGMGLQPDVSARLRAAAETVPTPWGPLTILRGTRLPSFWRGYLAADKLSRARRTLVARTLFPEIEEVSNTTHQGLLAVNDIVLGCLAETFDTPVPIVLAAHLPVPMVEMLPNLSARILARSDLGRAARAAGLPDLLRTANLLPHGGGYSLPGYHALRRVREERTGRVFELSPAARSRTSVFHRCFRHVPYAYRGEEVVRRVEELEMGRVVATGVPVWEFMI